MKKAKAHIYDYHKEYDADIDIELLNMKIRIYGEDYPQTGQVYYEGSIGKFIKERIPSAEIVHLLTHLRYQDKVVYRLATSQNYIERIK